MQRNDLTPGELAVLGVPGDLIDEEPVPARPKSTSVMFSLRVDRPTFDALSGIAEKRGRRFSDVAREALHSYVDRPADVGVYHDMLEAIALKLGVVVPASDAITTEPPRQRREGPTNRRRTSALEPMAQGGSTRWTNEELYEALARYEQRCRANGMTEKATVSYWRYALRFLNWRNGDFRPRGAVGPGPTPRRGRATVADLTADAIEYARDLESAGLMKSAIATYIRQAMFFVRWLDGTFIPGGRLKGLASTL